MFYLLLAAQAAGMVVDYMGTKQQQQMADMGANLQRLGIEQNIEQTRLEAEDATVQGLKKLRQNLGTQMAVNAARGTRQDAGNAVLGFQESIGNFNEDERMRRMNLLAKTTELKGQSLISKLNQTGENTKLWSAFTQRQISKLPSGFGQSSGGSGGSST